MRTFALILIIAAVLPDALSAQMREATTIHLRNPSFEDIPRNSMPPVAWTNCGFQTETPPDVQPDPMNQFQVTMPSQHGNTYLGMVVRDNDTWESVGQELTEPFLGGQCYDFRIQLARSKTYLSQSRVSRLQANYVTPALLRIYGGYDMCDRAQEIGKTEIVTNYKWEEYKIKLSPKEDFTHIIFEVYYKTPTLVTYNGNILLDNASPLVPMECDESIPDGPMSPEVIAQNLPDEPDVTTTPVQGPMDSQPRGITPPEPEPEEPTYTLGQTESEIKVDAIFQIEDITFKANSSNLELSSEGALQEIILFMRQNRGVSVEIGGHAHFEAGTVYANEISLSRAQAVVEYLRNNGIDHRRLFYNGYGKENLICGDKTPECQRRNQRVEVKIIKVEE